MNILLRFHILKQNHWKLWRISTAASEINESVSEMMFCKLCILGIAKKMWNNWLVRKCYKRITAANTTVKWIFSFYWVWPEKSVNHWMKSAMVKTTSMHKDSGNAPLKQCGRPVQESHTSQLISCLRLSPCNQWLVGSRIVVTICKIISSQDQIIMHISGSQA